MIQQSSALLTSWIREHLPKDKHNLKGGQDKSPRGAATPKGPKNKHNPIHTLYGLY